MDLLSLVRHNVQSVKSNVQRTIGRVKERVLVAKRRTQSVDSPKAKRGPEAVVMPDTPIAKFDFAETPLKVEDAGCPQCMFFEQIAESSMTAKNREVSTRLDVK
jgi:hypothetical protein